VHFAGHFVGRGLQPRPKRFFRLKIWETQLMNLEWHIITGSKGGVGKTMLTLLLLTRNLELGKSTLAIDLNAMNTDSSAILLEDKRRDKRIVIEQEAAKATEQMGANQIIVQKTFSALEGNLQRSNYAVGWPSNPFGLYKPTLFADLLSTIKNSVARIRDELELPKLQTVIIDTNYHFCNLFSQDKSYYDAYREGVLEGDKVTVWFMWVYRQLDNLIKAHAENDAKVVYATAAAIEKYLGHNDNPAPFMHVFSPVALVSSRLEDSKAAGAGAALIRLMNAIRNDDDDDIQGLENIEELPKGKSIIFRDWVERLETARINLQRHGHSDPHSMFLNMLIEAIKILNRDNQLERPMNVVPLSVYHAALQYYTDRNSADPVSDLREFSLYKKFVRLLG